MLDAGQGLVAARLGQQRDVVAQALVAIGAAQVEYLDRAPLAIGGIGQVGARRHDADAGNVERPVARVVDDDEDAHGVSFGAARGG